MRLIKFVPIENYKKWLTLTAKYFSISEDVILDTDKRNMYQVNARITFYMLCQKEGICVYRLSEHLNKHRSTIQCSLNNAKVNVRDHVKNILRNATT